MVGNQAEVDGFKILDYGLGVEIAGIEVRPSANSAGMQVDAVMAARRSRLGAGDCLKDASMLQIVKNCWDFRAVLSCRVAHGAFMDNFRYIDEEGSVIDGPTNVDSIMQLLACHTHG